MITDSSNQQQIICIQPDGNITFQTIAIQQPANNLVNVSSATNSSLITSTDNTESVSSTTGNVGKKRASKKKRAATVANVLSKTISNCAPGELTPSKPKANKVANILQDKREQILLEEQQQLFQRQQQQKQQILMQPQQVQMQPQQQWILINNSVPLTASASAVNLTSSSTGN
jgi:hypothetical protein